MQNRKQNATLLSESGLGSLAKRCDTPHPARLRRARRCKPTTVGFQRLATGKDYGCAYIPWHVIGRTVFDIPQGDLFNVWVR